MKEDTLFDTPEKIAAAINDLTNLLNTPGWILFSKILKENIEVLRNQLENGTEGEETKADVDRLRDKLKICKEMLYTPETIIAKLQSPIIGEPETDPYESVPEVDKLSEDS